MIEHNFSASDSTVREQMISIFCLNYNGRSTFGLNRIRSIQSFYYKLMHLQIPRDDSLLIALLAYENMTTTLPQKLSKSTHRGDLTDLNVVPLELNLLAKQWNGLIHS